MFEGKSEKEARAQILEKEGKNVNCKNPSQPFIRTFVWWRILPV